MHFIIRRILAYFLDVAILMPIILVSSIFIVIISIIVGIDITYVLQQFNSDKITIQSIGTQISYITVYYVVYFTFLEYKYGTTTGKNTFKLRVVSIDGNKVTFIKHFIRNLVKFTDHSLLIGSLIMLFSKDNKRFGDYLAKTKVVEV